EDGPLTLTLSPTGGEGQGEGASIPLLQRLREQITELPQVIELIGRAIVDEPPLSLKEGGLIRDGFDAALDELHCGMREGSAWIAQGDPAERVGAGGFGCAGFLRGDGAALQLLPAASRY